MIHPDDAALMYDGPIPAAVRAQFDTRAPRMFATGRTVAVRVKPKPEVVRWRMALVMATYAERGGLSEQDLTRAGFTTDEIEKHKADAFRLMLWRNPTLASMEMPA